MKDKIAKFWDALTGKISLPVQIASLLSLALVSVFVVLWVAKLSGVSESFLLLLGILLSPTVIICALVLYLCRRHESYIRSILNWITKQSWGSNPIPKSGESDNKPKASPSDTTPPSGSSDDFNEIKKKAEQGDIDAQLKLGILYDRGEGEVKQNYPKAVKWYHLAAEKGNAKAQSNLGIIYYHGKGIKQNHAEANKWFRLAAEQGLAMAQFCLGVLYDNGEGVAQNYSESYIWFSLASAGNYPNARKVRDQVARKLDAETIKNAQAEATRREEKIRRKREGESQ